MTSAETILDLMEKGLRTSLSFENRGLDRYLIHTGYRLYDGDELHIVLKKDSGEWILSDEGHTMMWLSYEDYNLTDSRTSTLNKTLASNCAELVDGRIIIRCEGREPSACLQSMVQALLQTADLIYLNKQTIRSTYQEDVRSMLTEQLGELCKFNERIVKGNEEYVIDAVIDAKCPIYVFFVSNRERCKDALVTMLSLGLRYNMEFVSLAFMDDSVDIKVEDRRKIVNQTDKIFFGTPKEAVGRYFHKMGISA